MDRPRPRAKELSQADQQLVHLALDCRANRRAIHHRLNRWHLRRSLLRRTFLACQSRTNLKSWTMMSSRTVTRTMWSLLRPLCSLSLSLSRQCLKSCSRGQAPQCRTSRSHSKLQLDQQVLSLLNLPPDGISRTSGRRAQSKDLRPTSSCK